MSLHSRDYIRDVVGHVPSAMLFLRSDEVSVFSRMNVQGRRRISLPAKLAGITEKVQSDKNDIHESLQDSYSQMKSKLDQLEEYNHRLEEQLSNIFYNISSSVNKFSDDALKSDKLQNIISEEDYQESEEGSKMCYPSSYAGPDIQLQQNLSDTLREHEFEHKKLILHMEEQLILPKISRKEKQELVDTSKLMEMPEELENKLEVENLNNLPTYRTSKQTSAFTNMNSLHQKCSSIIQPVQSTKKLPKSIVNKRVRRKSSNTQEFISTKQILSTAKLPIKYECNQRHEVDGDDIKLCPLGIDVADDSNSCEMTGRSVLLQQKNRRRFSTDANDLFSSLNRRKEPSRRLSKEDIQSLSRHSLSRIQGFSDHIKKLDSYNELNPVGKNQSTQSSLICEGNSNHQTSVVSFCTTPTSTASCLSNSTEGGIEHLSPSPPEYWNFHDESESVDEFFLFSEAVLNVDFDTVWNDLSIFSEDIGKVLRKTGKSSCSLKAANASTKWKTLWIYRGM